MDANLIHDIKAKLATYRLVAVQATDAQAREDYLRLAGITERLVDSLEANDMATARLNVLSFARQASDSFSQQPCEFRQLADLIAEVKKRLI